MSNQSTDNFLSENTNQLLRRGWTTGACTTACATASVKALIEQKKIDLITVDLPCGVTSFNIMKSEYNLNSACASTIKDAGDDPDVTHMCEITVNVEKNDTGLKFIAGSGVGTVTKAGLLIPIGQPAINPKPRQMIEKNIVEISGHSNWTIAVSVKNGEKLAQKTWNPRLGILGGISILGTTGVVIPFSCSAWIHSIHSGIDVARSEGLNHLVGSTGKTSERVATEVLELNQQAFIDMGDFVGGMLKYIAKNPVDKVTISGGFAKMVKLAQGNRDLHSGRSQINFKELAILVKKIGGTDSDISKVENANTALEVLQTLTDIKSPIDITASIAIMAKSVAQKLVGDKVKVEMIIISRNGEVLYKDAN